MEQSSWRDVSGWPYAVSSDGIVARTISRYGNPCFKLLKPRRHKDGYLTVELWQDGASRNTTISRLACEAFHGPAPSDEHQAAHNDGNPNNNRHTNLRWATPSENSADRIIHGTHPVGERNGHKFTREQAYTMRDEYWAARAKTGGQRLRNGEKQAMMDKHGISSGMLWQITSGKNWLPVGIVVLALLTGCGGPPSVVLAPRPQIPASLQSCLAEPVPGALADDSVLAVYIVDLANAGRDCRAKLAALSGLVR